MFRRILKKLLPYALVFGLALSIALLAAPEVSAVRAEDGTESPRYYLMCRANGYEVNQMYVFLHSRAEDEYSLVAAASAGEFAYYVYDAETNVKYFPNKEGTVFVECAGNYRVLFSPDRVYYSDGSSEYNTKLELPDFDCYLMFPGNGYELSAEYMLSKDGANTEFAEYTISFTAEENIKLAYYIYDTVPAGGEKYYPNSSGVVSLTAGVYAVKFSREHIYLSENGVYRTAVFRVRDLPARGSSDGAPELWIIDSDANYVYIRGEGITSDMTALIIQRGRYKFIEITKGGETFEYEKLSVLYYVGVSPKDYEVIVFHNKEIRKLNAEASGRYLSFEISVGEGFAIEEIPETLSAIQISLIVSGGLVVLFVIVVGSIYIDRLRRRKKIQKAGLA